MGGGSRHEHCLDLGGLEINLCHLQFIIEICHSTQTLDDGCHPMSAAVLDQKSIPRINDDIGEIFGVLADHLNPLGNREKTGLAAIFQNRDDHLIEVRAGSLDNVEVSVGDGVEGSRTNGALHNANASNDCGS